MVHGSVRYTLGRGLVAAGWTATAALGVCALMRLVAWDATEIFIVVNALSIVVYLPAWLIAIASACARRWLLAGAAVVIVAAQLAFVSPELFGASPVPRWARRALILRLFDANVDKSTEFRNGYAKAIGRYRPDLLTFEEFTPGSLRQLVKSGVLKAFPYRCVDPRYGADGFFVASRLPMSRCRVLQVTSNRDTTPYMVAATVRTRAGPIQLRVVHTLAPLPASWHEWVMALQKIDQTVRAHPRRNILMVGDFNATWNNRGFAALLGDGLTDAAAARGDAFEMTWPSGAIVPPFVRIDHVLTGNRLSVTRISAFAGFGSDHRYLTATVAVHD